MESIKSIMANISQSVNELIGKVDFDEKKDKSVSFEARQASLNSKVQESGFTLGMTRDVMI
jgi:hypothetical protein